MVGLSGISDYWGSTVLVRRMPDQFELNCQATEMHRQDGRRFGNARTFLLVAHFEYAVSLFARVFSYCPTTDSETTPLGRFYTGKGCRAMSRMSAFPEFFVGSRSVKCKRRPFILHFLPI
ncbi:hypothetical protein AVEN_257833-1 [Araneus ventricosus]|uniref:Uncharacterized protein n=1 Tax=Araneus ventricosus TaxID=182803 RepID=A0A4Y2UL72_ARAVE|nr:hypothetical protein AVEN_257833-1 [Araneus ventricosus]